MSFPTQAFEVFRDYTIAGVPVSGLHRPEKSDIRDLLGVIEAATIFGSRADIEAATIASSAQYIRTSGYAAAGDGGGALYVRVLGSGDVQSDDGAYWDIAEMLPQALQFGADNSGVANAAAALAALEDSAPPLAPVILNAGTYLLNSDVDMTGRIVNAHGTSFTGAGTILGGTVVTSDNGTSSPGFIVTHKAVTGTQNAFFLNQFFVNSDNVAAAGASPANGVLLVGHRYGGGSLTGHRQSFAVQSVLTATTGNAAGEYVAGSFAIYAQANDGGTAVTSYATHGGVVYAGNFFAQSLIAATYLLAVVGMEINVDVQGTDPTKAPWYVTGVNIVGVQSHALQGVQFDSAISVSGGTGSIGFRTGLLFTRQNGIQGVASSGTLIAVDNRNASGSGTTTATFAYAVDFNAAEFTSAAWRSGPVGKFLIGDTTDASSSTVGAVQITGGLAVAKQAWFGDNVTVNKANGYLRSLDGTVSTAIQSVSGSSVGQIGTFSNHALQIMVNTTAAMSLSATYVAVNYTTASTSTTTGALTVAGGLGVAGQVSIAGQFKSNVADDAYALRLLGATAGLRFRPYVTGGLNMSVLEFVNLAESAITAARIVASALSISGDVAGLSTTTSTSPTTGAHTIAGGLGVASTGWFGDNVTVEKANGYLRSLDGTVSTAIQSVSGSSVGQIGTFSNHALQLMVFSTAAVSLSATYVAVNYSTASSSTTTGSLTNAGGFGNVGAAWIGGLLNVAGATTLAAVTASGVVTASNTTDATSSTAAGVILSGGLAVAKQAWFGDNVTVAKANGYLRSLDGTVSTAIQSVSGSSVGQIGTFSNHALQLMVFSTAAMSLSSTYVAVNYPTASSSTTTGSLTNAGGFGNVGAAWIGGLLNVAGATTLQSVTGVGGVPQNLLHAFGTIKAADSDTSGIVSVGDSSGAAVNCGMFRGNQNTLSGGNWLNIGGYSGVNISVGAAALGSQTNVMVLGAASAQFPTITTTASAANAFLDSGNSNNLLRSTSSLRFKSNVEAIKPEAIDNATMGLNGIWYRSLAPADRKDWSWYGYAAEDVAKIDPRLVHWTREIIDYREEVVEYEVAVTQDIETEAVEIRVIDGRKVAIRTKRVEARPVTESIPLVNEDGTPVFETIETKQPDGKVKVIKRPATITRQAMTTKQHINKIPIFGELRPDGVQYERVAVLTNEKLKQVVKALHAKGIM